MGTVSVAAPPPSDSGNALGEKPSGGLLGGGMGSGAAKALLGRSASSHPSLYAELHFKKIERQEWAKNNPEDLKDELDAPRPWYILCLGGDENY